MAASRRNDPGEQGFVLIGAIWLLVLTGAVAALLLARGMAEARTAAAEGERLRERLVLESAVETVVADIVMNGRLSNWASLPAEAELAVTGGTVLLSISSEAGRIDLNHAELALIDRYLAALDWDGAARAALLQELRAGRANEKPIRSTAEMQRLLARASPGGSRCPERHLTLYSGLSDPDPAHADPELARLLGDARVPGGGAVAAGGAIRIEARAGEGAPLTAIVRIGGVIDRPFSIADWSYTSECQSG